MERITEITKQDIHDLFINGIEIVDIFEAKKVIYPYYGRIEEIGFLKRLYKLKDMESYDSRFSNAEEDIYQHTQRNEDCSYGWVFEDERFQLKYGSDELYLRFICEIFHPVVRDEKGYWKELLSEINSLLQCDGYELYSSRKISGRDVYDWRLYQGGEEIFIPYSQRNKKDIEQKRIVLKIKREVRGQLYRILERYDSKERKSTDTGFQYDVLVSDEVFHDIEKFYTPKSYNKEGQYVETKDIKEFILFTSPYYVLDAIEFFEKYCDNSFMAEINMIFNLNDLPLKLDDGKISTPSNSHLVKSPLVSIDEVGLKELLQEANKYYEENNIKIAVEKLWDAFERLKTYYSPQLDKKKSITKIIEDMSDHNEDFSSMFNKEFNELTVIGNSFRIRHHETTKINIEDKKHYDYLYKRCLNLITLATQYLNRGKIF